MNPIYVLIAINSATVVVLLATVVLMVTDKR